MLKDNYSYPMIFSYTTEGIDISAIDFKECFTFVVDESNALENAMDVLALTIIDYESENKELPTPTKVSEIELEPNEKLVYVNVWIPYYRSKVKETYVKKTLTIPTWLEILAKRNNINFSSILVKALKSELKLE
ncbi:type II toxin-antitoxin system HicB family antitoxin [Clostridium beijerinckii]|uniref:type II toxin-antitoxin system HicB family antitoxin n=1 Tax=Clostridium beijerinckii TaxID=1520 RepID=UPI00156EEC26|nr:type II toxin-antitoxin system HicB family antitoxin [Clostridium beijerinckii]NRT72066.1 putative RNase H-like HicB family nuclease [Clostridium beijerinckii]